MKTMTAVFGKNSYGSVMIIKIISLKTKMKRLYLYKTFLWHKKNRRLLEELHNITQLRYQTVVTVWIASSARHCLIICTNIAALRNEHGNYEPPTFILFMRHATAVDTIYRFQLSSFTAHCSIN